MSFMGFKRGDKVRCLMLDDNTDLLTVGNKYTVVGVTLFSLRLIANDGCLHVFHKYKFELDISSIRREKLKRIGFQS